MGWWLWRGIGRDGDSDGGAASGNCNSIIINYLIKGSIVIREYEQPFFLLLFVA